ncbi:MAG: DUF3859 domain-containing protein [Colwellia sp.]
MAKQKPIYSITTYGIYKHWDEHSKELPKIIEFTQKVNAKENIEFGFTLNVKKAKGKKLTYTIYHPNIPDDQGLVMPPFSGDIYVENNNWDFYLGDCIWPPIDNKLGVWRMTIDLNGQVIAEKSFEVTREDPEGSFKKRYGY